MIKPDEPPNKRPEVLVIHREDGNSSPASLSISHPLTEPENNVVIDHIVEPKPTFKEPTIRQGVLSIIQSSWLNILLVFVPLGWASNFVWSPTITFILNILAIIPLAKLLGFATEDISLRTGEVIGGLLNATFGNAVEMIIGIISLTKNLVVVVQASMLGSILSNLLLVLGMCFFCGGCKYKEQLFNITAAQTSASLLFISVVSLLLPAAFYGSTTTTESAENEKADILHISRATAIILLIVYIAFIFFQVILTKHRY